MKTLAVANGDLVLGARGFATVTGARKAAQDVGIALREGYGHDRFHPELGSVLPEFIGRPIGADTRLLIETEVKRVVATYMQTQVREQQRRQVRGEQSAIGADEAVVGLDQIRVFYHGLDRIDIVIAILTQSGQRIQLTTEVEG